MPDESELPTAAELALLPHEELAERLAEAYRVNAQLTGHVRELTVRAGEAVAENGRLAERVEALERQAGKDSSTSSKPRRRTAPIRSRRGTGPCGRRGSGPRGSSRGSRGPR